jgi:putative hydrolase of the HAD superfamily
MAFQLVCLDAGFTLLEPKRSMSNRLATVIVAAGGKVPTEEELRRAWEVADRWFWDDYHRPDNDTWRHDQRIEQTWRSYHTVMLRELGLEAGQDRLIPAILEAQFHPDQWGVYPDVEPALTQLRATAERRGERLTIGVISDWGSQLEQIVNALGLDRYLDFVLASGAVGLAKPDPAFFQLACARAGVDPPAGLMVGDSLRADVEGARAAGMTGILLDRSGEADAPTGVTVIRGLDELPGLVAGAPTPS